MRDGRVPTIRRLTSLPTICRLLDCGERHVRDGRVPTIRRLTSLPTICRLLDCRERHVRDGRVPTIRRLTVSAHYLQVAGLLRTTCARWTCAGPTRRPSASDTTTRPSSAVARATAAMRTSPTSTTRVCTPPSRCRTPVSRHVLSAPLNKTFPCFIASLHTYIHKSYIHTNHTYIIHYFPFQPVVHNWFIKGHGMYCSVYGKVHIKDPLLLIEKSSLCGGSGFPSKKCVNVTI